jgi:hypothetical protein
LGLVHQSNQLSPWILSNPFLLEHLLRRWFPLNRLVLVLLLILSILSILSFRLGQSDRQLRLHPYFR